MEMDETEMEVRRSVRECTRCELAGRGRGPVPWDGVGRSRMGVVGEGPGRAEDIEGRPFVGISGQLARGWVQPRFGDVAWLNVVSCFPDRTPTQTEVEACKVNLWAQLRIVQPEVLLLFGGIAMSAWISGYRVGEVRGRWVRCPVP